jgi:aminobenzoyl-glutamate transport protein
LGAAERRGLAWAAATALCVIVLWAALALAPGGPLVDAQAVGPERWSPFFRSLVAGIFVLFLSTGVVFGAFVGAIRSHRTWCAWPRKP